MTALLLPIALVQGRRFLATTRMAPPAAGPSEGSVPAGDGQPLRLAVVGDSTAAAHGVNHHDQGFAGQLARMLAERLQRPVAWKAVGQFGATTRRIRYRLVPRLTGHYDVAVLMAGANDVLARRTLAASQVDYDAILDDLTTRASRVVALGAPPFRTVPALPWALSRYLAARAERFDSMAHDLCRARGIAWIRALTSLDASFFAGDGFHPSATGYRIMATVVAETLEPVGAR